MVGAESETFPMGDVTLSPVLINGLEDQENLLLFVKDKHSLFKGFYPKTN